MRRSSTAALSILATQPCLSVPRPSKMNEIVRGRRLACFASPISECSGPRPCEFEGQNFFAREANVGDLVGTRNPTERSTGFATAARNGEC